MSDHVTTGEAGFSTNQMGVAHPNILPTTVCSIVEHGGELLMVRQLNREGEERWNFPTGWMEPVDEDGLVQLPEHSVNRNLLMETGYAASDAHLIGVSLVREHDPVGHRVGTSLRLNYLCGQPRQTSYAVNDPDILGAPEWFSPDHVDELIQSGQVKGELTAAAFRHWRAFRRDGSVSADIVDIPN
ncbi:MAG TPA: NUDIX domain-containing protein [Gaiellales bacterium]|jgi:ADP-ribose pyrophosphatase YjhB (NUDIX family)|nr:NUDIX domain-containing protein [Gaiellales bacterium]